MPPTVFVERVHCHLSPQSLSSLCWLFRLTAFGIAPSMHTSSMIVSTSVSSFDLSRLGVADCPIAADSLPSPCKESLGCPKSPYCQHSLMNSSSDIALLWDSAHTGSSLGLPQKHRQCFHPSLYWNAWLSKSFSQRLICPMRSSSLRLPKSASGLCLNEWGYPTSRILDHLKHQRYCDWEVLHQRSADCCYDDSTFQTSNLDSL